MKRIIFFSEDRVYGSALDQHLRVVAEDFTYGGWYQSFDRLLLKVKTSKPDFLILEIPRQEGLLAIKEIKKSYGSVNIVVVSTKLDHASILQTLKKGVHGYLVKSPDMDETMIDIHKLAKGGVALSSMVARSIVSGFWKTSNSPLTRTETKVLKFISLGYTYASLAKTLEITKGTAKTHLKNIYRKLNIHRKSDALEKAYLERLIN
jgi:DNA-binding NarL/FixJ family response regulator